MPIMDHAQLLASIQEQRATQPLSILNLAEPLLSESTLPQPSPQQSKDTSIDSSTAPASIDASTLRIDLQHYRDLFSKLRFSYLEQVTKEKYLRSIVGDPPVLVTHDENVALENKLAVMKAELKAKKEENEQLVRDMEVLAEQLAEKYERVSVGVAELETLPEEIAVLEAQVKELKEAVRRKTEEREVDGTSDDPRMNMSLVDTQAAVEEQRRRVREVDAEIAALQAQLPGTMRECEKADRELEEMERQRNEVTSLAREVKRIKEEGGRDVLEEQGRWLRGEEAVLRALLGIKTEG